MDDKDFHFLKQHFKAYIANEVKEKLSGLTEQIKALEQAYTYGELRQTQIENDLEHVETYHQKQIIELQNDINEIKGELGI